MLNFHYEGFCNFESLLDFFSIYFDRKPILKSTQTFLFAALFLYHDPVQNYILFVICEVYKFSIASKITNPLCFPDF